MTENATEILQRELAKMTNPVRVLLFTTSISETTGQRDCPACQDTANFLRQIRDLAKNKIILEEYSLKKDPKVCQEHFVTRVPTILLPDHGIRYTGAPIGLESVPLIQTIVIASTGMTGVPGDMVKDLQARAQGKIIRTIVTPTCPYCPTAVSIANRVAIASKGQVTSEVIESYEHGELAARYQVTSVPAVVIGKLRGGEVYDDAVAFLGVPSGRDLVEKLTGHSRVEDTGMYS